MRIVNLAAFALALASAFLLYGINYDTRQLEARVQGDERAIDEARNDIAVLKAERAHLGTPGAHRADRAGARSAARGRAADSPRARKRR